MKNLVTAAEAVAGFPHITAEWLAAEARAGRVPSVKLGRRRLYDPDDIDAWVERQKQGTDPFARSPKSEAARRRSA